jgi:hypothetical protein
MGRWLILGGLALVVAGVVIQWAPWLINWFGRLPGDIRIEGERTKVLIPITSMLLISVALTLLINLVRR